MSCRWWPSTIHRPPSEERRSCGGGRMHHTAEGSCLSVFVFPFGMIVANHSSCGRWSQLTRLSFDG